MQLGRAEAALTWWGSRGSAAEVLAERSLRDRRLGDAERYARLALSESVTNTTAIRTLAAAAEAEGKGASAATLMEASARWGWRDTPTQLWLLRRALAASDLPLAFQYVDALLRRQQAEREMVAVITNAVARDAAGASAILPHFQARPKWRSHFFASAADPPNSGVGLELIATSLARTEVPPTAEEIGPYIRRLIASGGYARAAGLWQLLFPVDVAILPPDRTVVLAWSAPPRADEAAFGWRYPSAREADVSLQPDGRLEVAPWSALTQPVAVRQLVLRPGSYLITGIKDSGLAWNYACRPSGRQEEIGAGGALSIGPDCLMIELVVSASSRDVAKAFSIDPVSIRPAA